MLNTEQFAASTKANFEALTGLTAKAYEGLERLTALNLQVARTALGEASETGLAALSAKDPSALLALQANLLRPDAAERASAYGKQVYTVVADFKGEVDRVAGEQVAASQAAFFALIETAGKNVPEGSGNGIALLKSALTTANNAFAALQTAGRQAAETAEGSYAAATGTVVKAGGKAKRG